MNVLLAIQLLLVSLFLLFFFVYLFATRRFITGAIRTNAKVLSIKRYQATKSSVFIPTLSFMDQTGQEITIEANMSGASSMFRKTYQANDMIAILYQPSNPKNFITDNLSGRYIYTFKKAAPAVLILIIAGMIFIFTR
ncbi:hypothetical protein ACUN24_20200 [Pedobacter sp. WC2501]|uniref:hypothetical protein n=1 Tax=Pedobacter sp. WC2501 TaxID=3461400 RepID=UPI004045EEDA